MIIALLVLAAQSSVASEMQPSDALKQYRTCVSHMAWIGAPSVDPADGTAEVSAVACEKLLAPAVEEVLNAASGSRREAARRVAIVLEANARDEAVARRTLANADARKR